MPLRIKLPSKDKIIINGAVLENAGESTTLIIHNRVDILRRKEVMKEEDAITPARRIYYALQCAYLFEADREAYLVMLNDLLDGYLGAAPSAKILIDELTSEISKEKFYGGLKLAQKIIDHEAERLKQVGAFPG